MKPLTRLLLPALAALAVAACNAGGTSSVPGAAGQSAQSQSVQGHYVPEWQAKHLAYRACPDVPRGFMRCDALIEYKHAAGPNVAGWAPTDYQTRYELPITQGSGQIVAVVDAYDNPDVASDLAEYRSNFSLGTGNFTKYNQEGQTTNFPTGSPGWGVEIDLDVEMVSATCPLCTIYLIEANSNSGNDLYAAEAEAVKLGATIVTNSWGGGGGSSSGGDFNHPGITYLASAGDSGYGTQDPADYSTVVSVGGTMLNKTSSGVYHEIVWGGTGGGCSVVAKPAWQHDPGCKFRTMNDVAAVAVGAAEYDTYSEGGWITVDGTSISSPLVAGMYGLAGNSTSQLGGRRLWKLPAPEKVKDFHLIKLGTNGCPASLSGSYLCTAGTKQFGRYSGPNGWGTPKGVAGL